MWLSLLKGSSAAPSLAACGDKLYAAWKGIGADQQVWYAAFDGAQWLRQAQIPGAATVGSPTLSVSNNKLYATWEGANGQPIVAFCANNDDGALVSGHEWTVVSCDPQKSQITLRNPWGNFKTAGTSQGGVLYDGNAQVSMTLQQFGQFYNEVTFGYEKA